MEDDLKEKLNGSRHQWRRTSMEDNPNEINLNEI